MDIAPGTRCAISPSELAFNYYFLPNYDGILPLCTTEAKRHKASPVERLVTEIAKKNVSLKAQEDAEILALIHRIEEQESKED